MAKKNDYAAAAAGVLEDMTQAKKMLAQNQKKGKKDLEGFTIWTAPENVKMWKTYQRLKKGTLPTIKAFVETAIIDYMNAHPVTDEEMDEYKRKAEEDLSLF